MAAGRLKIDIRRKRILELLAQNGFYARLYNSQFEQ